jgi:hypothetical protein
MNGARGTQSAISQLLGLLSQPRHDYRPSTQIFLDLNVDRITDELQLLKNGTDRGAENRPAADAQTFDDIEHKIIERIEAHKQDAHSVHLEHLHTYDERLIGLNFEERFAVIQQAAPEAVGDFRAEAALGRDELFALRRRLYDSERERELFRKRNRIARPARLSTPGQALLKVGVLAVLFVIEVVINGSFLAKSNEQGLLGGAMQAVSFAALNIVASFLWGLIPIRLLNRRFGLLKLLGFISLIAYFAFAALLNLTLAHLREIPPTVSGDVGHEVLMRLLHAPLELSDVNTWVFFAIGFIFSIVAMADGLLYTDPHIGYGPLERRWIVARTQYTDAKAELIEKLREIRNAATTAMNENFRDLSVRRGEFDAILQARNRLKHRFTEHQNHIERAGNALLAVYREANCKARSLPAPDHFSRPYKLERIVYAGNDLDEQARNELRQSILFTQDVLRQQTQSIHDTFEEAVRSYLEIDDLIPETRFGPAASRTA